VRHGRADRVDIEAGFTDSLFQVSVIDNGCGMDPSKESPGMGLRIMKYRAKLMGASLLISASHSGTAIRLTMPAAAFDRAED